MDKDKMGKMRIGNRQFDIENECYIMGILNVTPDSFSDGGKWNNIDAALRHTEEMIAEGCDIVDIGGESTRPGHEQITAEEETERVVPVIKEIKKRFDVPVSLDTYKSSVAYAGVEAGADMINDIWGCRYASGSGKSMAHVMASADIPVVLMHNRNSTEYDDYLRQFEAELGECVSIALEAGVKRDKIILDPGIGFGKTCGQNLQLMNNLEIMNRTGAHITSKTADGLTDGTGEAVKKSFPWLLGTSRKSMIGLTLDLPADQRLEGTLVTTVFGVAAGCSFIRVHDVKENLRAVKMTRAILGAQ